MYIVQFILCKTINNINNINLVVCITTFFFQFLNENI